MAFKIPDGQEVKSFGYTVYHADTGERAKPTDIKLDNGSTLFDNLDEFILDDHGNLGVCPYDAEDWRTGLNDTRHQCRWCTSLCTGNGIWCSEKKKCLSESYTKRVNKCPDFQFVNMDAYTFEEYKQRVRHNNQCEGQVSLF